MFLASVYSSGGGAAIFVAVLPHLSFVFEGLLTLHGHNMQTKLIRIGKESLGIVATERIKTELAQHPAKHAACAFLYSQLFKLVSKMLLLELTLS